MIKVVCDTCKRDLLNGEPYLKLTFPAILKDGLIKEFYAESQVCSKCTIKMAKFFKVPMSEENDPPEEKPLVLDDKVEGAE